MARPLHPCTAYCSITCKYTPRIHCFIPSGNWIPPLTPTTSFILYFDWRAVSRFCVMGQLFRVHAFSYTFIKHAPDLVCVLSYILTRIVVFDNSPTSMTKYTRIESRHQMYTLLGLQNLAGLPYCVQDHLRNAKHQKVSRTISEPALDKIQRIVSTWIRGPWNEALYPRKGLFLGVFMAGFIE